MSSQPPFSVEPLRRALRLAARGRFRTSPNPRVGAVVVARGRVVGEGYHHAVGRPHAEVEALRAAGEAGRGATVYVSLEPCSHHGRTPPCVDLLIAAGISRLIACHRDPDRRVAGRGFERLRAAGIEVHQGYLVEDAVRLNLSYLVGKLWGRPQVTLKWAMSLDGKIATSSGESRWITGKRARNWALDLREEHDAVAVGSGTVLADDPRLDRRLGKARRPNVRVIFDRRLRTPIEARAFRVEGEVLIYTESRDEARQRALEQHGATVIAMVAVTPQTVLPDLFARGVRSLLVEGGGELIGAFHRSGLFERVEVAIAPRLLGGKAAPSPLGGEGIGSLAEAPALEGVRLGRRGGDVLISGVREGCLRELSLLLER